MAGNLAAKRTHAKSKAAPVVLLFISVLTLIFALMKVYGDVHGGAEWPQKILFATLPWVIVYVITSYAYFRSVYLFLNAYLLALAMFHVSLTYMLALGIAEFPVWLSGDFSRWLELGSWYVLMAFGGYGIGVAAGLLVKPPKRISQEDVQVVRASNKRFLYIQGVGLLLASIVFLILAIYSYGNILAYTRQELYGAGHDPRGLRVFMMVFPGAALLLLMAAHTRKQKIFGVALVVIGIALFMLSGYRSAALFPLLIGAVIWVKTGGRIPIPIAVASVVLVLVAISLIGIFRQMGAYQELGTEQLKQSYEAASIERALTEMGQTLSVAAHVLRLVPSTDKHTHGASYWKGIKEMVPNIGFTIDTTYSRADLGDNIRLGQDVFAKMQPSDWMTYRIKQEQFGAGGGVGFSAVMEPYLNFGTVAVPIFFMVLGYLLTRLDLVDLLTHRYAYLFAATMLWPLIRTVRNDFSNFLKPLGFTIVILVIWNIGLKIFGKNLR